MFNSIFWEVFPIDFLCKDKTKNYFYFLIEFWRQKLKFRIGALLAALSFPFSLFKFQIYNNNTRIHMIINERMSNKYFRY